MRYVVAVLLVLLSAGSAWAETCFLKQSTAVDIKLGPFLDATDGITAETALTIAQADVRLKKNAAAWAQKNQASSCTHEENGNYECNFDTTDTNTAGQLYIHVAEAGAVPVWMTCVVLPAHSYDAWIGTAGLHQHATIVTKPDIRKTSTGVILTVPIKSALTGGPLAGVVFGDVSLEICRKDQGNADCTLVSPLLTATRGSWATDGFVQKDATNADYEVHVRDAAWGAGAEEVTFTLFGSSGTAVGMAPTKITVGLFDLGGADLGARLPTALVSGRIDSSVGAVAANALDANAFAADAGTELAGAVWTTALPGAFGAGTAGKLIGDNVNATISSIKAKTDQLAFNASGGVQAGGTYRKNIASQKHAVYMISSATGLPLTGGTITLKVSKDIAALVAKDAGTTITEIGGGWYGITFAATDVNCDICAYTAEATGASQRAFYFNTGP